MTTSCIVSLVPIHADATNPFVNPPAGLELATWVGEMECPHNRRYYNGNMDCMICGVSLCLFCGKEGSLDSHAKCDFQFNQLALARSKGFLNPFKTVVAAPTPVPVRKCTNCGGVGHGIGRCDPKICPHPNSHVRHIGDDKTLCSACGKITELPRLCASCGKEGHSDKECFRNQDCSRCGKHGHPTEKCWQVLSAAPYRAGVLPQKRTWEQSNSGVGSRFVTSNTQRYSSNSSGVANSESESLHCDNCDRSGHATENCYRLQKCSYCFCKGHIAEFCYASPWCSTCRDTHYPGTCKRYSCSKCGAADHLAKFCDSPYIWKEEATNSSPRVEAPPPSRSASVEELPDEEVSTPRPIVGIKKETKNRQQRHMTLEVNGEEVEVIYLQYEDGETMKYMAIGIDDGSNTFRSLTAEVNKEFVRFMTSQ